MKTIRKSAQFPDITAEEWTAVREGRARICTPSQTYLSPPREFAETQLNMAVCLGFLRLSTTSVPHRRNLTTETNLLRLWRHYCYLTDQPVIYFKKMDSAKWFCVKVEHVLSQNKRTEPHALLESVCKRALAEPGLVAKIESRRTRNSVDWVLSDDMAEIYWLEEGEAITTCQNIQEWMWYGRTDYAVKDQLPKENRMVKLFKDGKSLALQTDAASEHGFTRDFATALQDYITSPNFEGQYELETWLNNFYQIRLKMGGYKAEGVREQRLLTVGDVNPGSEMLVNVSENGRSYADLPDTVETTDAASA